MANKSLHHLLAETSRRDPLDLYELLKEIGSGTYGEVYKVNLTFIKDWVIFYLHKLTELDTQRLIYLLSHSPSEGMNLYRR